MFQQLWLFCLSGCPVIIIMSAIQDFDFVPVCVRIQHRTPLPYRESWVKCLFICHPFVCSGNGGSSAVDPEAVPMLPLISPRDRESPTVAATSRKNSSSAKPISPAPPRHVEISQSLTAADSTQVSVRDLEPLQLGQYERAAGIFY